MDQLSVNQFKIVASPGLVLGIAAGDVVETEEDGGFRVISRGGNLAIQLYGDNCLVDEHLHELGELSHAVDGRAQGITILTVPVQLGFSRVERVLSEFCRRHSGIRWYYGNVYDTDGVTPLNWWAA